MSNLDIGPAAFECCGGSAEPSTAQGGRNMEFVIGLAIMAIIWIVVIYGSSYVNKNIQ
jgi:hypothetical protein